MKVPEPRKLPSGTWFIQMRLNGVSVPVTASSKRECKRQAELVKAEHRAGKRKIEAIEDITVSEAITQLIEKRKKAHKIEARSIEQYEDIQRLRFKSLMQRPISAITENEFQDAVSDELDLPSRKGGKLSTKTVKDAHAVVAAAIHLFRPDFNTDYDFPEITRKFYDLLTPEEIFKAVYGTDIELPALLAMWLSFTASEIRGLTKSKSIKGDQIFIVETVVNVRGVPTRKAKGKEFDRVRALTLPPYIKSLIDAVDGDIIEPRTPRAINARFQKVLEQNGLKPMRFHDLRKVNASLQITLGLPATVILQRNGWSTPDMLNKVYAQTFTNQRKEADKIIDGHIEAIIENIKQNC